MPGGTGIALAIRALVELQKSRRVMDADRIQEKERPPAWLWALVAVVLALAAWAIMLTEDPAVGNAVPAAEIADSVRVR